MTAPAKPRTPAVERALAKALERTLPGLLERALGPVQGEVAVALADVEASTRELLAAQEATRVAQAQLESARERIALLERQLAAVAAQPAGLFRRRPVVLPV